MKKVFLLLSIVTLVSCVQSGSSKKAKNVVYFIGDGMGPAMITGARLYKGGSTASMNFDKMTHTGFSKTYSFSDYVTDSAAGATTLATGVKTYNGSIGKTDPNMDPTKSSRDLQTLVDLAIKQGKSIGIVSTASVTHATPASFYAHAKTRKAEALIAEQINDSKVSLLIGGGRAFFEPMGTYPPRRIMPDKEKRNKIRKDERKDKRNLINELKGSGWTYAASGTELKNIDINKTEKIIGLFHPLHMSYEADREKVGLEEPSLTEMTEFAIKFLSKNKKGFFLMVESGRIDHAAHFNWAERTFSETIELDNSVGKAFDMTGDDTLVVVTADHETSGLSILGYGKRDFAVKEKMLTNLKVGRKEGLNKHSIISWGSGPGYHSHYKADESKVNWQQKATYFLRTGAHSAVDVPVMAKGPGAFRFTGYMSNHEIPLKIAESMGSKFSSEVNKENLAVFP